jgi:hypothetical protein
VRVNDKLLHAGSYLLLMVWFVGLYRQRWHLPIALMLFLIGVGVELPAEQIADPALRSWGHGCQRCRYRHRPDSGRDMADGLVPACGETAQGLIGRHTPPLFLPSPRLLTIAAPCWISRQLRHDPDAVAANLARRGFAFDRAQVRRA